MSATETDLWELYRGKIIHEITSSEQRVSWLLGFSALLLVAFAAILNLSNQITIAQTLLRGYLLIMLPIVGFLIALLVYLGLLNKSREIKRVLAEWHSSPVSAEERQRLPSIYVDSWLSKLVSQGICIVFLIAWLIAFVLVPLTN